MIDVPAATPVSTAVAASIVATLVLALIHVPPARVLARVEVPATQTLAIPVIDGGVGLTENTAVLAHPVEIV